MFHCALFSRIFLLKRSTWNRDLNAAINLWRCMVCLILTGQRPRDLASV